MKYFSRKSLLWTLPLLIVCVSGTIALIWCPTAHASRFAVFITVCYLVTLILAASCGNYPRLTDKGLEIRNIIFWFQCKSYPYEDIENVAFCYAPKHACVRIYLKSSTTPIQHGIDGMSERLRSEFIEELRSHGIGMAQFTKDLPIKTRTNKHRKNYLSSISPIIIHLVFACALLGFFIALAILDTRRVMIPLWIMSASMTFAFFLIMVAIFGGYPVLTENELVIRNVLYRSYKKRFAYDDIRKVEICHGDPTHSPCLKIYLHSTPLSVHCDIDCMSQSVIPEFIAGLSSKGVEAVLMLD